MHRQRQRTLLLSFLLVLVAAVGLWQIGYSLYPERMVEQTATRVDVERHCDGWLDCNSHCDCLPRPVERCYEWGCEYVESGGIWVVATHTSVVIYTADANGDARSPYTILALSLVLIALVVLVASAAKKGSRGRFEPDVADLGWQEIEGL